MPFSEAAISGHSPEKRASLRDTRYIKVEPDVLLRVIEAGSGRPIVILPGWSQTADQWTEYVADLSDTNKVTAIDMRGHGASSKPMHGYRISRLAADLQAVLNSEGWDDITLIGHSMGCAIIWSYLELYSSSRIRNLVLVDQPRALVAEPHASTNEDGKAAPMFSAQQALEFIQGLRGLDGVALTSGLLKAMTSDVFPPVAFDQLLAQNLLMPRDLAGRLLYDHVFKDWTDVIRRIDVPTLVIGAQGSIAPWQAMVEIGEMISGSETFIFAANDGGSHFAFLENPKKLLQLIKEFLERN
ncbi:alpha/beta fold hydrolase [Oryzifoliimicrobium ureilyticus]|uniref:alpha/beta fold hydrolase n=1 Tax=Oryzifoliimicrobium ureilyticus TaxID=3113724 RepID=UPI0030766768